VVADAPFVVAGRSASPMAPAAAVVSVSAASFAPPRESMDSMRSSAVGGGGGSSGPSVVGSSYETVPRAPASDSLMADEPSADYGERQSITSAAAKDMFAVHSIYDAGRTAGDSDATGVSHPPADGT
jgi:hypothetical protein